MLLHSFPFCSRLLDYVLWYAICTLACVIILKVYSSFIFMGTKVLNQLPVHLSLPRESRSEEMGKLATVIIIITTFYHHEMNEWIHHAALRRVTGNPIFSTLTNSYAFIWKNGKWCVTKMSCNCNRSSQLNENSWNIFIFHKTTIFALISKCGSFFVLCIY